jgi:hypothetical protein
MFLLVTLSCEALKPNANRLIISGSTVFVPMLPTIPTLDARNLELVGFPGLVLVRKQKRILLTLAVLVAYSIMVRQDASLDSLDEIFRMSQPCGEKAHTSTNMNMTAASFS